MSTIDQLLAKRNKDLDLGKDDYEEFVALESAMTQHMIEADAVVSAIETVTIAMEHDSRLHKEGKLRPEDIEKSSMDLFVLTNQLGIKLPVIGGTTLESRISGMSLEALDGTRKTLLEQFNHKLSQIGTGIMDVGEQLSAYANLVKSYKTDELIELKRKLEAGELIVTEDFTGNEEAINKKLAIFYSMGKKLTSKDLIGHLNLPYELIVKDKLYSESMRYATDTLVVSVGNEESLEVNKTSLKILDSIKIPAIRKWLNKDTKFGMLDRFLGNRVRLTSVYQDEDGADLRNDIYTIPETEYNGKKISTFSKKELLDLLDFGIELGGSKASELKKESIKMLKFSVIDDVKKQIGTYVWSSLFSIFAIRRQLRHQYLAAQFNMAVINGLMVLLKSHNDSASLIINLVKGMTEKK